MESFAQSCYQSYITPNDGDMYCSLINLHWLKIHRFGLQFILIIPTSICTSNQWINSKTNLTIKIKRYSMPLFNINKEPYNINLVTYRSNPLSSIVDCLGQCLDQTHQPTIEFYQEVHYEADSRCYRHNLCHVVLYTSRQDH